MAGTETRYCANCGERISARSRFCPSCGARQEDFLVADMEPVAAAAQAPPVEEPVAEPPPPPPEPVADEPPRPQSEALRERIGRVDPQAGELSELLMGHLAVPGVVAAGLAALAATAGVLVAGLIIAVATPDASILGSVGRDGGSSPRPSARRWAPCSRRSSTRAR